LLRQTSARPWLCRPLNLLSQKMSNGLSQCGPSWGHLFTMIMNLIQHETQIGQSSSFPVSPSTRQDQHIY
jgi:hypothetical protein